MQRWKWKAVSEGHTGDCPDHAEALAGCAVTPGRAGNVHVADSDKPTPVENLWRLPTQGGPNRQLRTDVSPVHKLCGSALCLAMERMAGIDDASPTHPRGRSWARLIKRPVRPDWMAGLAVRRELPEGGHDIGYFGWERDSVLRAARRDWAFWRRGPWRPVGYAVVEVSRRDFALHRRREPCHAVDCPTGTPLPLGAAA